jgi:membrane protein YqaA with SNARE-associated domain
MRIFLKTAPKSARVAWTLFLGGVAAGSAVYFTFNPVDPMSQQQYLDLNYHPWASAAGAAFPSILGSLIVYTIWSWTVKKHAAGNPVRNSDAE